MEASEVFEQGQHILTKEPECKVYQVIADKGDEIQCVGVFGNLKTLKKEDILRRVQY